MAKPATPMKKKRAQYSDTYREEALALAGRIGGGAAGKGAERRRSRGRRPRQCPSHLQAQGYGDLLYLSEATEQANPRQVRLKRCLLEVTARGFAGEVQCQPLMERDSLQRAIGYFLACPGTMPRALLWANGNATLAARALQDRRACLGQIRLMGIDKLDWCELVSPDITTLAQPTDAIVRAAVTCLM